MSPAEETYLDMAKAFESQGDFEKALVWYRKIINNGDVYETIGEYLYLGRGCGKNECEAKKYFEKAAEYGNVDAFCNLALCEKELEKKLECYKNAAARHSAYAMNMAGIISEELREGGEELPEQWFKKSADAGSEAGCYNYAMYCENDEERMKYLELAVEKECIPAMEMYIFYLEHGCHCKKNEEKAAEVKKKLRDIQSNVRKP